MRLAKFIYRIKKFGMNSTLPPRFPEKPAMVIELKYNRDAETALLQIKKQNYPARLEHYKGNILLVGIDYDKDISNTSENFKYNKCVIETA